MGHQEADVYRGATSGCGNTTSVVSNPVNAPRQVATRLPDREPKILQAAAAFLKAYPRNERPKVS